MKNSDSKLKAFLSMKVNKNTLAELTSLAMNLTVSTLFDADPKELGG